MFYYCRVLLLSLILLFLTNSIGATTATNNNNHQDEQSLLNQAKQTWLKHSYNNYEFVLMDMLHDQSRYLVKVQKQHNNDKDAIVSSSIPLPIRKLINEENNQSLLMEQTNSKVTSRTRTFYIRGSQSQQQQEQQHDHSIIPTATTTTDTTTTTATTTTANHPDNTLMNTRSISDLFEMIQIAIDDENSKVIQVIYDDLHGYPKRLEIVKTMKNNDNNNDEGDSDNVDDEIFLNIAITDFHVLSSSSNNNNDSSNNHFNHRRTTTAATSEGNQEQSHHQESLNAAMTKWNTLAMSNYMYSYQRSCFCTPDYITKKMVLVENDAVSTITDDTGKDVTTVLPDSIHTIDELFQKIQGAIDYNAIKIEVTYHDDYGYPTLIDIDYTTLLADEEFVVSIDDNMSVFDIWQHDLNVAQGKWHERHAETSYGFGYTIVTTINDDNDNHNLEKDNVKLLHEKVMILESQVYKVNGMAVQNGVVSTGSGTLQQAAAATTTTTEADLPLPPTMLELFDLIQNAIDNRSYQVLITYNEQRGNPINVHITHDYYKNRDTKNNDDVNAKVTYPLFWKKRGEK